jgi:hypothetical protein
MARTDVIYAGCGWFAVRRYALSTSRLNVTAEHLTAGPPAQAVRHQERYSLSRSARASRFGSEAGSGSVSSLEIGVVPGFQVGLGLIECHQQFHPGALALFPQGKGFPHRVFFVVQPSALNGLPDKGFLARGELYFHCSKGSQNGQKCQVGTPVEPVEAPGTAPGIWAKS